MGCWLQILRREGLLISLPCLTFKWEIVEHQELDLLQRMLSLPEKERKGIEGSSKKAGPPPELMSTLVAAARNLERHAASGLTGSRTQDAHGILRPSHNLPTISLAEQVLTGSSKALVFLLICRLPIRRAFTNGIE